MELASVDVSAEVATINKTGRLGIQEQQRGARHDYNRIERGTYVPDDAHIDICLNCTKEKCTGYCKRVKGARRKRG